VTFRARSRQVVLAFADVAEADSFATGDLVVADADGAFFALWDMSALVADEAVGIAFFVDDDGNIRLQIAGCRLQKIFIESFLC